MPRDDELERDDEQWGRMTGHPSEGAFDDEPDEEAPAPRPSPARTPPPQPHSPPPAPYSPPPPAVPSPAELEARGKQVFAQGMERLAQIPPGTPTYYQDLGGRWYETVTPVVDERVDARVEAILAKERQQAEEQRLAAHSSTDNPIIAAVFTADPPCVGWA